MSIRRPSLRTAFTSAAMVLALTLVGCGSDNPGVAAPAGSVPVSVPFSVPATVAVPSVSVPSVSVPSVSVPASIPELTTDVLPTMPSVEVPETSEGLPDAPADRDAAVQLVAVWVTAQLETAMGSSGDQACVATVVDQLSDADLSLMVEAALANEDRTPDLSPEGDALGNTVTTCFAGDTTGADPTDVTDETDGPDVSVPAGDRAAAEAAAYELLVGLFQANGLAGDEACIADVVSQFSDEDLALLAQTSVGDDMPPISAEGEEIANSLEGCSTSTTG